MTRFEATDPTERQKLYVDSITAHRTRGSHFLTLEADNDRLESDMMASPSDETNRGRRRPPATTPNSLPSVDPVR